MYLAVHPLRRLIAQGEGETLDFKRTITSARKIGRTLCAFANTKGGRLLVGVRDNGKVAGVATTEEVFMVESAAKFFCDPPVEYQVTEHDYKGLAVLEVFVPPSDHVPHFAQADDGQWQAYIRYGDKTLQASLVMLNVLKQKRSPSPNVLTFGEPERQLLGHLRERQRITLPEVIGLLGLPDTRAIPLLVNLISMGVLQVHHGENQESYALNPVSPAG